MCIELLHPVLLMFFDTTGGSHQCGTGYGKHEPPSALPVQLFFQRWKATLDMGSRMSLGQRRVLV